MLSMKTPTVRVARQGFGLSDRSPALDSSNPTLITLENQQIDVVALIAARSGVAAATVRAHCLAYGIGGAR